jgi:hypothetical protein
MKSKELIKRLQEEDPSGEGHVVVDNKDIFFLEWKPGYWDGRYTVLVRDEKKKPYYDIVGAEYRSDGDKLNINTMDWEDVLLDDPDAPIKVVDTFCEKKMQAEVDKCRANMKAMYDKFEAKALEEVTAKINDGWQIRQKAEYPITKCHHQEFFKDDKIEKLNQGQCIVVVLRNKFIACIDDKNPEYIYWRLKDGEV